MAEPFETPQEETGQRKTMYLKFDEQIDGNFDIFGFLENRLPSGVEFIVKNRAVDSGQKTTLVTIESPSGQAASNLKKEMLKVNDQSETKIFCFDTIKTAKDFHFRTEQIDKVSLESLSILSDIVKRSVAALRNHDVKLTVAKRRLDAISELKTNRLTVREYQKIRDEEIAVQDKVDEMHLQRKEFQCRLSELTKSLFDARQEPYFDKHVKDDQNAFIVESYRLENSLPMYARRAQIIHKVKNHQVLIVIGETGSGKSTQLTQFIYEGALSGTGMIACTQPRKIAAISLATRVAEEMNSKVGQFIGFKVGMQVKKTGATRILYMTDHVLLNECLRDRKLSSFSCIIIDEAHERSICTDLLLGMIKDCLKDRPDLRVIITSATIDPSVFVKYFNQCPVLKVSGRMYPVEIVWQEDTSAVDSFENYQVNAVDKAIEVHKNEPEGDILVFLTSPQETEKCAELMKVKLSGGPDDYVCLQIHGKLQTDEQQQVFEPTKSGERKIVFATNSAETSVTTPGIKYVIDTGVVKEMAFDVKRKINTLSVTRVTQSSANQRKGRAGRTGPGKCFRLYSEPEYNKMTENTVPEILKVNLSQAVLKLMELDIDPLGFDFVMAPSKESMEEAVLSLDEIGAVSSKRITDLGRWIAKLPLDPKYSALVHDAIDVGLGYEGIIIGAVCASGSLFYRSGTDEKKEDSDRKKIPFCDEGGDMITSLRVFKEWSLQSDNMKGEWCSLNSINGKSIKGLRQTVNEVASVLKNELNIDVKNTFSEDPNASVMMRQLILKTFKRNICCYLGHPKAGYYFIEKRQVLNIHPSSALKSLGCQPQWFVFDKVMRTSRDFAMNITPISDTQLLESKSAGLLDIDIDSVKRKQISEVYNQSMGIQIFKEMVGPRYANLKHMEDALSSLVGESVVFILDADKEKGDIRGFTCSENKVHLDNIIGEKFQEITKKFKKEEREHMIGNNAQVSGVRAVLGEGGETLTIYMPDEFRTVKVHYKGQDKDIDEHSVLTEFQKFGKIVEVKPFRTNANIPSLWGQLTFEWTESAKEAVRQLIGEIDGFSAKPYLRLPKMASQEFKAKMRWCRKPSRGFGFIKFYKESDATRANALSNIVIKGTTAKTKAAKNDINTLHVSGLDKLVDENLLRQSFSLALDIPQTDIEKATIVRIKLDGNQNSTETIKNQLEAEIRKYVTIGSYTVFLREPKDTDINFFASVTFSDSNEGKEVCSKMNAGLFLGVEKVSVLPDLQCSVFIHKKVYEVTKTEIEKLMDRIKNQEQKVNLTCKPLKNGNVIAYLHSEYDNAMAECKSALQDLIRGDPIKCENDDVSSQLFTREGHSELQSIMMKTHALIITDNRIKAVSIHGTEQNRNDAKSLIDEYLVTLTNTESKMINLKSDGKPVGTLKVLMKEFGIDLSDLREKTNSVFVRVDIRRHRLYVTGSIESIERVEKLIKDVVGNMTPRVTDIVDGQDCVVCYSPIQYTDAYQVECCGHLYCKECIQLQLESAIAGKDFPILCAADDCKTPLVSKDFTCLSRRGLVTEASLVDSSLTSFVSKNKDAYRYCITPDCPVVYRITENGQGFVCPECDITLCTKCHIQFHDGMTCAMYENSQKEEEGAGVKLWMQEDSSNRKFCPSCTTAIEKISGCQRMTCGGCKKHICWNCLEVFDTSSACYSHLQKEHGSFF